MWSWKPTFTWEVQNKIFVFFKNRCFLRQIFMLNPNFAFSCQKMIFFEKFSIWSINTRGRLILHFISKFNLNFWTYYRHHHRSGVLDSTAIYYQANPSFANLVILVASNLICFLKQICLDICSKYVRFMWRWSSSTFVHEIKPCWVCIALRC